MKLRTDFEKKNNEGDMLHQLYSNIKNSKADVNVIVFATLIVLSKFIG